MSGNADDAFKDFVDRVRPPTVKFLDPGPGDDALAAWCVARDVQVIGRLFFDPQSLGAEGGRQIKAVVTAAHTCPSISHWELHNESWSIPGEMERYADLSIEFMQAMKEIGRTAVIGCFSEGTPQVDGSDGLQAWREYAPAVQFAIDNGHILGLHEYSGPYMQFDVGADGRGWHTLRYRRSLDVLAGLGVDVSRLRIAITESGIDDVNPRPGPQGKGWRDYEGTEWARPPISPAGNFAGQMHWYCSELSKDKQIVGVVDFGWAHVDPTWQTFDLADTPAMLQAVADLQLTIPAGDAGLAVTLLEGCDVSQQQVAIDWAKLRAHNEYVWLKAAEGDDLPDETFAAFASGASGVGIPWGPCHHWLAAENPVAQAAFFEQVSAGWHWQLPPALELEDTKTPTDMDSLKVYITEVERRMGRPIIYTSPKWAKKILVGDVAWLADYPLWLAQRDVKKPTVPAPWSDWAVWQYGGGDAAENGVLAPPPPGDEEPTIDKNRTRLSLDQLIRLTLPATSGLDWEGLSARIEARHAREGLRLNGDSALMKAVLADHLLPTLNEADDEAESHLVTTRGEDLNGRVRHYVYDKRTGRIAMRVIR
jgi:GH25 family lysozyme M1 (1,4-beta-N-acetylmuramidase)